MPIRPIIITTWRFGLEASRAGWRYLERGASALDAIEAAANITEEDPTANSVGYGGLPNSEGVVELDAAIMDGLTHSAGAVGALTSTRRPISVARRVMERTPHVMLVGQNAVRFARNQGFPEAELLTETSRARWETWRAAHSAPDVAHFDVVETALQGKTGSDRSTAADPYRSTSDRSTSEDHDTIGLCALDRDGNLAVGCTTSGLAWKLPGRIGDSPLIGSGLYVDNEIGGAAATGNGDEIMKACLSYRVVMSMERGLTPQQACEEAVRYLQRKREPGAHGNYGAAVIAINREGDYGAAASASGFQLPDRLWQWAIATEEVPEGLLNEGPYVTLEAVLPHLI